MYANIIGSGRVKIEILFKIAFVLGDYGGVFRGKPLSNLAKMEFLSK
jgi:hypothetical protein